VFGYVHGGWCRAEFVSSLLNALSGPQASKVVGGAFSTTAGPLLALGRNTLTTHFLQTDVEWLCMVDTDIVFAGDTADRLLASADPAERPVVGSLYHVFEHDRPVPATWYNAAQAPVLDLRNKDVGEDCGLVEVTATGCGFLLVHRDVFLKIREEGDGEPCWFREATIDGKDIGEDVSFCLRVRMCGWPVYVNTDLQVGHIKHGMLGKVN
jgi:GT2 family glycosyltransferase